MFQLVASCLHNIAYKLYYVLEGSYVWDVDYSYIEDWLDSLDDETVTSIFAFDPDRRAIMLLGGDKSKGKGNKRRWSNWCRTAIPQAERIYEQHLHIRGETDGQA